MSKHSQALLAMVGMNLIYGLNYPIAKGLLAGTIGPSGFILLRDLGAVSLFLLMAHKSMRSVCKPDIARLALCAVFGIAVNQLCFFHGLARSTTVNAGIIMCMTPILVVFLSALVLKERLTATKLFGVAAGACGALMIVLQAASGRTVEAMHGDIYLLVNAISYGLFLVLVKPLMKKYNPLVVAAWLFSFGTLYVFPFGFNELAALPVGNLSLYAIIGLSFVVLCATFLAYLLNMFALRTLNPGVVSSTIYIQPLLAVLFSWLLGVYGPPEFGGGTAHLMGITWKTICAALLIFFGVYLTARSDRTAKPSVVQ